MMMRHNVGLGVGHMHTGGKRSGGNQAMGRTSDTMGDEAEDASSSPDPHPAITIPIIGSDSDSDVSSIDLDMWENDEEDITDGESEDEEFHNMLLTSY
jgi:hypothetical protein